MATNRLEHIKAEYLRSAYSDVPGEDVQWLVRRVEKLQRLCQESAEWHKPLSHVRIPFSQMLQKLEAAANGEEV